MQTSLLDHDSPDAIFRIHTVYTLVTAISYFVLLWDWASHLREEWTLIVRRRLWWAPSSSIEDASGTSFEAAAAVTPRRRILSLGTLFIFSRYVTLVWCTFVVITLALVSQRPGLCRAFKYFPYGYSVASLASHLVLAFRIHSIYERKAAVLYSMLVLAVVDCAVQMSANHAAYAVLLRSAAPPSVTICFTQPSSPVFALTFISPTILHHTILGMTLWKSIGHLRITREAGIASVMSTIQRDHVLYVLAICLVNFSNLVLSLQPASWPYKLINQFPAAAFTQIFLSRIVFSLRKRQVVSPPQMRDIRSAASIPLSPTARRFGFTDDLNGSDSPKIALPRANTLESSDIKDAGFCQSAPFSSAASQRTLVMPQRVDLPGKHGRRKSSSYYFSSKYGRRFSENSTYAGNSKGDEIDIWEEEPSRAQMDLSGDLDIVAGRLVGQGGATLGSYRLPSPRVGSDQDGTPVAVDLASYATHTEVSPSCPPSPRTRKALTPVLDEDAATEASHESHEPRLSYYGLGLPSSTVPSAASNSQHGHAPITAMVETSQSINPGHNSLQMDEGIGTLTARSTGTEHRPAQAEGEISARRAAEEETEESQARSAAQNCVRRSTIDDDLVEREWAPPDSWGSPPSPCASPLPYSERRLSASLGIRPVSPAISGIRRLSSPRGSVSSARSQRLLPIIAVGDGTGGGGGAGPVGATASQTVSIRTVRKAQSGQSLSRVLQLDESVGSSLQSAGGFPFSNADAGVPKSGTAGEKE